MIIVIRKVKAKHTGENKCLSIEYTFCRVKNSKQKKQPQRHALHHVQPYL